MALAPPPRRRYPARAAALAACACVAAAGCGGGGQPAPLGARALAEAQTFPFYRVYWVGPRFGAHPLVAADGLAGYSGAAGQSVYYGDCASGTRAALGGGCVLPLQVTTTIYARRANAPLGPQRNALLRGVPATIYDEGRSIELYSGRVAIDVAAAGPAAGLRAVAQLRPLNAPGAAVGALPAPVYCPGLTPARPAAVQAALAALPGRPCQRAARALEIDRGLFGKG